MMVDGCDELVVSVYDSFKYRGMAPAIDRVLYELRISRDLIPYSCRVKIVEYCMCARI